MHSTVAYFQLKMDSFNIYVSTVNLLPLIKVSNRFLCAGEPHRKTWIPLAWDKVSSPTETEECGLAIRSLWTLNQASLARTVWHFLSQTRSTKGQTVDKKYPSKCLMLSLRKSGQSHRTNFWIISMEENCDGMRT